MIDLILLGGGGHCRSCIDVIELEGRFNIVGILDHPDQVGEIISGYNIVGDDNDILTYVKQDCHFLITVGQIENADLRIKLFNLVKKYNGKLATVVSPRAYVSGSSSLGDGTIVMHDVLINTNVDIQRNCIINTKALIEHDCTILAHCHISTASVVNGGVTIGEGSFFGSNAVSKQGITIPSNSFVRAGRCFTRTEMTKKVALLTTLFPTEIDYIIDFFDSLSMQTEAQFDVIVLNDGFVNFNQIKDRYSKLRIIELDTAGSIAKNREKLIRFAKVNQYDIAIFGDIDDTFSCERVERSIVALNENDIIVNELTAVHEGKVTTDLIYSKRIADKQFIDFDFIKDKNVMGLSNTAINLRIVCLDDIVFSDELIAVDWYFFSLLLIAGHRAQFRADIMTYYRQYGGNTIGIGSFTKDKIKSILNVKKIHFKLLFSKHSAYEKQLDEVNLYIAKIVDDKGLESALNSNVDNIKFPLWWELVKFRNLK